ncbi:hypothetical protein [Leptospira sp. id769339]|uniref:hypothetical protein n=1 Tax=Leptospira sp. id769339 TaxID=2864221 RepID=UPI00214BF180|nr:hypothetical protein [Leptospira sp. id769339]MCR1795363.1 hypothetical protein [Leptospira sp. id769339]
MNPDLRYRILYHSPKQDPIEFPEDKEGFYTLQEAIVEISRLGDLGYSPEELTLVPEEDPIFKKVIVKDLEKGTTAQDATRWALGFAKILELKNKNENI